MISSYNTLFIGKVLYELASVGSTNQYAIDLISKSKPSEGSIVITSNQYAGRGQATKHWESEPGKNLTFSLILYPTFLPARQQFYLNQAISLGILATVQHFVPKHCTIKWPNDLYVEDRKITGMLMQNTLQGTNIQTSIAGIGLNVNQTIFTSDAPNPTSIQLETATTFSLQTVLERLCKDLEHQYLRLRAGHVLPIQEAYQKKLYRFEEPHLYKRPDGRVFEGTIKGVTDTGQLKLQTKEGEEHFALKEIQYLIA